MVSPQGLCLLSEEDMGKEHQRGSGRFGGQAWKWYTSPLSPSHGPELVTRPQLDAKPPGKVPSCVCASGFREPTALFLPTVQGRKFLNLSDVCLLVTLMSLEGRSLASPCPG